MISYQNIKTVSLYERKTLMRSWFFKIFAIIALLGITLFHILTTIDIGISTWPIRAIPANIPYLNIKYLNIIQSIVAVFLASGFIKRDKKFDTSEVIYVRPMSNAEYILGKTLGIFKVFIGLNIISLSIAFIVNTIGSDVPVDIISYILYPLIISVPSILFILGLSFILMIIIKNQSITFLILLGYIALCVFYFGESHDGLYDYTSFHLPLLNSDIIGFANINNILLHRGAYVLLGFGFIFLTILKLNRLPHCPRKIKVYLILSIIFIISGACSIGYISYGNTIKQEKRHNYKITDNTYFNTPTIDINNIDIKLTHKGKSIICEADLIIQNNTDKVLSSFILSLNPGLEVYNILCDNKDITRERKGHILILTPKTPFVKGEKRSLKISYGGTIDETICFRDIEENTYNESFDIYNVTIDKKFAFITNDFVLLTPESLWYPTAGLRYNSKNPVFGKYHFSNYSLNVTTNKDLTAVSQGKYLRNSKGEYIFKPQKPLTQLSLVIGEFEQKKLIADSLEIRMFHFKGHDYFSPVFADLKDTIPSLIKEFKDQYELEKKRNYPFKRVTLVEVPAQFKTFARLWTTHRETVQPEMFLLPEYGITLPGGDFSHDYQRMKKWRQMRNGDLDEEELKINIFNRAIDQIFRTNGGYTSSLTRELRKKANIDMGINSAFCENIYSLDPNFYTYVNNIYSPDYPVVNTIFESITNYSGSKIRRSYRSFIGGLSSQEISNIYLKDHSLNNILLKNKIDFTKLPAIVENKANYLNAILTNKIGSNEFKEYFSEYLERHKFTNTSFNNLITSYCKHFNIDIREDINLWYNSNKIPGYIISDVRGTQIIDEDSKKYQLELYISNPEPNPGIIDISVFTGNMRYRRRRRKSSQSNEISRSYYLEGNSSNRIGIVCANKPMMININTLTSKNIPSSFSSRFEDFEESKKKPFDGIEKTTYSNAGNNEIIVDNEDAGFSLEENIKEIKLKSLFKKKEIAAPDEKYKGTIFWRPPIKWTLTAKGNYYGKYIRSAYYVKGGDGKQRAIWKADIKNAGYYDVYFFKPEENKRYGSSRRSQGLNPSKKKYDITVCSDDGENKIEVSDDNHNNGWVYLGSYYFSSGEAKVILSNKSESRIIYADAVKWVKKQQ